VNECVSPGRNIPASRANFYDTLWCAMDASRRTLLKAAAVLLVEQWSTSRRRAFAGKLDTAGNDERKIIVVSCAGIRRARPFTRPGFRTFHLYANCLRAAFLPLIRNAGAPPHSHAISSAS